MQGNGARAVLVCVYGNRAYEDTLVKLEDAAVQAGFQVVAGVAAIAESTPSPTSTPPDVQTARTSSNCRTLDKKFGISCSPETTPSPRCPATAPTKRRAESAWCPSPPRTVTAAACVPPGCPEGKPRHAHRRTGGLEEGLLGSERGRAVPVTVPQRGVGPRWMEANTSFLSSSIGFKHGDAFCISIGDSISGVLESESKIHSHKEEPI